MRFEDWWKSPEVQAKFGGQGVLAAQAAWNASGMILAELISEVAADAIKEIRGSPAVKAPLQRAAALEIMRDCIRRRGVPHLDLDASYVIDEIGGPETVAAVLGCDTAQVVRWRNQGIPDVRIKALRRELDLMRSNRKAAPAGQAHRIGRWRFKAGDGWAIRDIWLTHSSGWRVTVDRLSEPTIVRATKDHRRYVLFTTSIQPDAWIKERNLCDEIKRCKNPIQAAIDFVEGQL